MKAIALLSAAVLGGLLAVHPVHAASDRNTATPDVSRTGVEQTGKNQPPQWIREGLADFRQKTFEQRDAAIAAARKLMDDLQATADKALARMKELGGEAEQQWRETSAAFHKQLAQAEVRVKELQAAAAEKWNEARTATAEALERAARAIEPDKAANTDKKG